MHIRHLWLYVLLLRREAFEPDNLVDCLAHYLLVVDPRKVSLPREASVSSYEHFSSVNDNKNYVIELRGGLNEVIPVKHLVSCLAHSKNSSVSCSYRKDSHVG